MANDGGEGGGTRALASRLAISEELPESAYEDNRVESESIYTSRCAHTRVKGGMIRMGPPRTGTSSSCALADMAEVGV